jgi:hypothetical protein
VRFPWRPLDWCLARESRSGAANESDGIPQPHDQDMNIRIKFMSWS